MKLKFRRYLSIVLLVVCSMMFTCQAYANNTGENVRTINGTYSEGDINYEYVDLIYEDGTIYSELYVIESDGSRTLTESFTITTNGKDEIYMDGVLVATITETSSTGEGDISPLELYPIRNEQGIIDMNPLSWTTAQVIHIIVTAIMLKNPLAVIGEGLLYMGANHIANERIEKVPYNLDTQLETFPSDVPFEYQGAITKVEYWLTLYDSYYSSSNLIDSIHGFNYGMPY